MTAPSLPVLMLVPTGIGCDIGGYAGDALPSARLLAADAKPAKLGDLCHVRGVRALASFARRSWRGRRARAHRS